MTDFERHDEVRLQADATVVEVFDDGSIDVVLDDYDGSSPFGIHLTVSPDDLSEREPGKFERTATCQKCGGDILLEVDLGEPDSQDARILATCDSCENSAWLSWEEIPSRATQSGGYDE